MARTITAAALTALAAETVRPIQLVRLDFPSGAVVAHTGVGNIEYNGDTYLGIGNFGGISGAEENDQVEMHGISLSLTGIPNEFISLSLTDEYQGHGCIVYMGLLDEGHQLIIDPFIVFSGRIDTMTINMEDSASIQVTAESVLAAWDRPNSRRYNDADQQLFYPGDLGFEFIEEATTNELLWGKWT